MAKTELNSMVIYHDHVLGNTYRLTGHASADYPFSLKRIHISRETHDYPEPDLKTVTIYENEVAGKDRMLVAEIAFEEARAFIRMDMDYQRKLALVEQARAE